ncbi:MAG: 3,4-dihydroxy-2-butanone-4-phosphate synthase, partial [Gemmobacter sp.]|nr:3,4-dihydroxy-2-butanone-4-phosphate synthase [Gemmobacter sp.]
MFANPIRPQDALPVASNSRAGCEPAASERLRAALAAFQAGAMLIVTDDDDRENEGDLIMAAVHCTTRDMAFIVRHTSGIVCTPITPDIADRLNLPPMVARNDAPFATAFTVSVDYRHGTTTGISAADRSLTVQNLARADSAAADFVRPGHIFPLVARAGGVLERDGHTEAAVDLCRLTGLPPVGVICELVNDDGSVMRGDDLALFRHAHG